MRMASPECKIYCACRRHTLNGGLRALPYKGFCRRRTLQGKSWTPKKEEEERRGGRLKRKILRYLNTISIQNIVKHRNVNWKGPNVLREFEPGLVLVISFSTRANIYDFITTVQSHWFHVRLRFSWIVPSSSLGQHVSWCRCLVPLSCYHR